MTYNPANELNKYKAKRIAELKKYSYFGPCKVCGKPLENLKVGQYSYYHKHCRKLRNKVKDEEKEILSFQDEGMGTEDKSKTEKERQVSQEETKEALETT